MTQTGYLVISDISGYSKFLHESELDHARDSLEDLLNLLVDETRSPLRIVELEGDAVFSCAPAGEVTSAEILTSMIEDCYVAFRHALNLMVINTTCGCKACRLLPTLDLKFFIHYGSYARQQVAQHAKLVGNEVNLIHRLLKNSISDATGFKAYAAYTASAVEELRLDRAVEGFVSHVESYDDVGEVEMCVQDMHGVWEQQGDRGRIRISEKQAIWVQEAEFELAPEEMWSYITDPVARNLLTQSDWQELKPRPDGGIGPGATYVCAHGDEKTMQTIVDWDPPESYTIRTFTPFPNTSCLVTYKLDARSGGSRLQLFWAHAQGPLLFRWLVNFVGIRRTDRYFEKGVYALKQRIRADHEQGSDVYSHDRRGRQHEVQ